jgi:pilus assembly protein CpaE
MNAPMKAFVALDRSVDRQLIETLLTSSSRLSVVDYGEIDAAGLERDAGDVIVVACAEYTPAVSEFISRVAPLRASRPVILMAPEVGNGYVSDAFANGADDIVTLPEDDDIAVAAAMAPQVVFVLEKALARKREAPAATARDLGEMICVLGLKGGSGKTLTVANLAVSLADAGRRVAAVDLDLQFGDLGLALGLEPTRTLYDLIRAGGSLDAEKLADFQAVHSSGVRVLLAPTRPDHGSVVTGDFLRDVYQVLRETNDFVIIDTPPSFTPEVIGAVDSSTAVCMVTALDSLSLKNSKLGFETLELMDYDNERMRLVLNRADSKVGITPDDVVAITKRMPAVLVPSDRHVTRSINEGKPISQSSPRSDAAKAFRALSRLYLDDIAAKNGTPLRPKRQRLFRHR